MRYFLLVFIFALSSCAEEAPQTVDTQKDTDSLTIQYTEDLKSEVPLFPEAKEYVAQWTGYEEMAVNMKAIDTARLVSLESLVSNWAMEIEELRENVPDTIGSKSVMARLTLLQTKAGVLAQELSKRQRDTARINKEATEFKNAFRDLNQQLNIKFNKSVEDFLKEFEEESRELRSRENEQRVEESYPIEERSLNSFPIEDSITEQ